MKNRIKIGSILFLISHLVAGEVNITKDLKSIVIQENGKSIKIERIQDTKHRLTSNFSKTSRECPPFCVQPMNIGNTKTIGEIELLKYIKDMQDDDSNMLLIDARTREWYKEGTIPSSINLPFTMLKKNSKYLNNILKLLGAKKNNGKWNFDKVPTMIIFSNGLWDAQATKEINTLLELGCPSDKILYYRGGMQSWNILGLTTK
ncbi:MAG: rhodanese-like domain-containing protein [Sulfurovaceae bacterium]|nr:rhodanese-like domain-containing protein [Sulfurovaceae bacterium]